jgi:hypothetical protein
MMKELIERFKRPTPYKIRKIGYALLATFNFLAIGAIMPIEFLEKTFTPTELRWFAFICIIAGGAGKFITSFYTETIPDDTEKS